MDFDDLDEALEERGAAKRIITIIITAIIIIITTIIIIIIFTVLLLLLLLLLLLWLPLLSLLLLLLLLLIITTITTLEERAAAGELDEVAGALLVAEAPEDYRGGYLWPSEKGEVLLGGVGALRRTSPPDAYVQWQPDGLAVHTKKWFLGAGFLGWYNIAISYTTICNILRYTTMQYNLIY